MVCNRHDTEKPHRPRPNKGGATGPPLDDSAATQGALVRVHSTGAKGTILKRTTGKRVKVDFGDGSSAKWVQIADLGPASSSPHSEGPAGSKPAPEPAPEPEPELEGQDRAGQATIEPVVQPTPAPAPAPAPAPTMEDYDVEIPNSDDEATEAPAEMARTEKQAEAEATAETEVTKAGHQPEPEPEELTLEPTYEFSHLQSMLRALFERAGGVKLKSDNVV